MFEPEAWAAEIRPSATTVGVSGDLTAVMDELQAREEQEQPAKGKSRPVRSTLNRGTLSYAIKGAPSSHTLQSWCSHLSSSLAKTLALMFMAFTRHNPSYTTTFGRDGKRLQRRSTTAGGREAG
jgi:hypothetical protein